MIQLSPTPVLTTERLILRAPVAADWPHWLEFQKSDRAEYVGGGPDVKQPAIWRAFGHVIGHWVMRGFGMFVFTLKDDNTALGMTGPWFPEGWPEREIGWSVWTPAAEGKGYVREAAMAARAYAYETLGWETVVSYIDPENIRSIALAERLGAVRDDSAAIPDSDKPCLVYRHPNPSQGASA